ncbi:MAG TPA: TonB-dependent receptor, partial [Bacteroidales bacterium]
MKKIVLSFLAIVSVTVVVTAQSDLKQTIRGKVIDKASKMPLPGASIMLLGSDQNLGTASNADGDFRIPNVPIGRQGIKVTFLGYKPVIIENLIISSGKETVLEIELEESAVQMNEITVNGILRKDEAINKMAAVSARSFTVEETEKYAGSRGDVARMAANFAGVLAANDSRNDIVIRGNSPSGLLWRLDDIDIPNPNHFAENGTTGGPVSMLNNNLLMNSDFFTGAFPAEYGNALSGVFDLKMRNGNNEKHEFLFQSGFNGFEAGAEGPFSKNHKSSYLVNARYSTLELVSKFVDFGTAGVPKYKDLSFKLNFPVKKGRITLFGVGGTSEIAMLDSKKTGNELYTSDGMNLYNRSSTGVMGATYSRFLSNKTYVKLFVSGLTMSGGTDIDTLDNAFNQAHNSIHHSYTENRMSAGLMLNSKVNARFSLKSGITYDRMGFNLDTKVYKPDLGDYQIYLGSKLGIDNGPSLVRSYVESSYHFTDEFTVNPGMQVMYFDLNKQISVEPRLGASWQFKENQRLSLGYGLHSQIQTLYTYYYL